MDLAAIQALLAPDVILETPLTDSFRFEGRTEVLGLLTMLFSKADYIDYHTNVGEGSTRVVGYHGRTHRIEYEEYLVLSFDEQHRVQHIVATVRGVCGHFALLSSVGPQLLRAHHSRWSPPLFRFILNIATRVMVAVDRWVLPLAEAPRGRT